LAEASIAAERVRAALAAASFVRNGQRVAVTVSIGVSSGSPTTAVDLIITRADDALYRAKANGRNRVETATVEAAGPPEACPQDGRDSTQRRNRRKEEGAVNNDAPESCIA
jgi:predicted signal transduction protein with EAL and GGDEF domain